MQIIIRAFLQNDRRRGIFESGLLDRNRMAQIRSEGKRENVVTGTGPGTVDLHGRRRRAHRRSQFRAYGPPFGLGKVRGASGEDGELI